MLRSEEASLTTLYIAAAICAAGFSQVEGEAGVYAPLLRERYHGTPASQMVDCQLDVLTASGGQQAGAADGDAAVERHCVVQREVIRWTSLRQVAAMRWVGARWR